MAVENSYNAHRWWKEAVVYQIYPASFLSKGAGSQLGERFRDYQCLELLASVEGIAANVGDLTRYFDESIVNHYFNFFL